jgi:nogalonic acid methyl ester cyclase / aklanonic acid methyl ester cyclase
MSLLDKNTNIIRKAFDAINKGYLDNIEEFISSDYINHDSSLFDEALGDSAERANLNGPVEFRNSVRLLRNAFADLHFEEKEIITTEDKVVARVVMSGRHVNNFMGSPPTQREFSAQQIHIFHIAGSKIIEHRAVRDDLSMMLQLGLAQISNKKLIERL